MPGMSGVDLQAHLLTQGYRVPFIFFTAFPDERIRAQALRAGAICYLTKPIDGDSLVQGLQAALKEAGQLNLEVRSSKPRSAKVNLVCSTQTSLGRLRNVSGEHRAFSMLAYVWRRTRDAETSAYRQLALKLLFSA